MGKTCEWSCRSCGLSWRLDVGHGMNHALLQTVAEEFPPEMRQEIGNLAAGEKWPVFNFNFRPALCSYCRSLVATPEIEFPKKGRTITGGCTLCGHPVNPVKEDEEILCPHCGGAKLEKTVVGDWD